MKSLPVDLVELCLALDSGPGDLAWYLDVQTGEVVLVNSEYDPAEMEPSLEDIEKAPERFICVPTAESDSTYGDMQAFLEALEDPTLKESLQLALSGPGSFRRFKAVLGHVPEQRKKWLEFKNARLRERAREWLGTLDIEVGSARQVGGTGKAS